MKSSHHQMGDFRSDAEVRLDIATAAADIGIWDWDILRDEMVYSARAKAICGFAPDQPITYQLLSDQVHPEDLEITRPQSERALDPNIHDSSPYEYRIIRPDGAVRWVLAYGRAIFARVDGETRAVRYVGTIQDITERRRLEDAHREAAQRLQLAIAAGRMAVWEVDSRTETLIGSADLNRILGFEDDRPVTMDQVRNCYAPGERQRLEDMAQEVLARGERFMEAEYHHVRPDGKAVWLLLRCEFVIDRQGGTVRAVGVITDITERKGYESALARRAAEQAALFEFTNRLFRAGSSGDVFGAALDAITGTMRCNRASILLFDAAGVMRFVAWRGLSDEYRRAVDGHSPWTPRSENPAPIYTDDIDASDLSADLRETIRGEGIRALAFIPLLARGRVIGKFMAYYDAAHAFTEDEINLGTTIARQLGFSIERRQAEDQRDLLLAELSHRVKNTLTTVMSIARQSFSPAKPVDEARYSFEGRLRGLAQTHNRLAASNWSGASLETMLEDELMPYRGEDGGNIEVSGPPIELNPSAAVTIGMVVHELVTNAAKYGALTVPQGRVGVTWRIDPQDPQLVIDWAERDGPPVSAPTSKGFGRLLLERAVGSSLSGDVRLRFDADGVKATLRIPLAHCVAADTHSVLSGPGGAGFALAAN